MTVLLEDDTIMLSVASGMPPTRSGDHNAFDDLFGKDIWQVEAH